MYVSDLKSLRARRWSNSSSNMIGCASRFIVAFPEPPTFHETAETALLKTDDAAEVSGPDLAFGTEFCVGVAAVVGRTGRVAAHFGVGVVEAGVGGG